MLCRSCNFVLLLLALPSTCEVVERTQYRIEEVEANMPFTFPALDRTISKAKRHKKRIHRERFSLKQVSTHELEA